MVYKTGKSHNNPSCRAFTLFSCSIASSVLQILKLCRVVDSNHSLWLLTSHLTTLRLHIILTKTSTNTDKCSSCQERLISLSPNLIFRTTPFYFVTYFPFCNLIGLQYTLQREQLDVTSHAPPMHAPATALAPRVCTLVPFIFTIKGSQR